MKASARPFVSFLSKERFSLLRRTNQFPPIPPHVPSFPLDKKFPAGLCNYVVTTLCLWRIHNGPPRWEQLNSSAFCRMSESRKKGEQTLVLAVAWQTLWTTSLGWLECILHGLPGCSLFGLVAFAWLRDALKSFWTIRRYFGIGRDIFEILRVCAGMHGFQKILARTKISWGQWPIQMFANYSLPTKLLSRSSLLYSRLLWKIVGICKNHLG